MTECASHRGLVPFTVKGFRGGSWIQDLKFGVQEVLTSVRITENRKPTFTNWLRTVFLFETDFQCIGFYFTQFQKEYKVLGGRGPLFGDVHMFQRKLIIWVPNTMCTYLKFPENFQGNIFLSNTTNYRLKKKTFMIFLNKSQNFFKKNRFSYETPQIPRCN